MTWQAKAPKLQSNWRGTVWKGFSFPLNCGVWGRSRAIWFRYTALAKMLSVHISSFKNVYGSSLLDLIDSSTTPFLALQKPCTHDDLKEWRAELRGKQLLHFYRASAYSCKPCNSYDREVCLFVCLSHAGTVWKRRRLGSRNLHPFTDG